MLFEDQMQLLLFVANNHLDNPLYPNHTECGFEIINYKQNMKRDERR